MGDVKKVAKKASKTKASDVLDPGGVAHKAAQDPNIRKVAKVTPIGMHVGTAEIAERSRRGDTLGDALAGGQSSGGGGGASEKLTSELEKVKGAEAGTIERGTGVQANIPGEFRQTQLDLVAALEAQSRGEGQSIAQGQLKMASDRALSQQLALAAQSRTPAQGALAQRLASRQAGEQQQALAGQSGLLRLQEQMQAQQLLSGVSGAARGQDLAGAGIDLSAQQSNQSTTLAESLANLSSEQVRQDQINTLLGIEAGLPTAGAPNRTQAGIQGAATGAAAGSTMGPWGALGMGVLGGLASFKGASR